MATSKNLVKDKARTTPERKAPNIDEQSQIQLIATSNNDWLNSFRAAREEKNKRLEESYTKLMKDYESLQTDYNNVVELNITYIKIISELTQLTKKPEATQRDNESQLDYTAIQLNEYEQQVKTHEAEIKQLKSKIDSLNRQLIAKENELKQHQLNNKKIHEKLKLPENVSIEKVEKAIEELLMQQCADENARKLVNEAGQLLNAKSSVLEDMDHIKREQRTLELQLTKKNLNLKKLTAQHSVTPTLNKAKCVINESRQSLGLALVDFDDAKNPSRLTPMFKKRAEVEEKSTTYCVLCREDRNCDALKHKCYIHYRKLLANKYLCCGKDAKTSGCLSIPHHYIEKVANSHSFKLTDGIQFSFFIP